MIVFPLVGYTLLFIYELLPLYHQKLWKDFAVTLVLGLGSLTIAVLLCLGTKIPSPESPIREFILAMLGK
ncbi:MAG TPA: hypothetical protein VHS59_06315 [Bacillota bacterium]|nr:hypothetical protein [Bacillota bacterium]